MQSPSRAVPEHPTRRLGVLLGALAVLVAACGGSTGADSDALVVSATAPDWLIERAGDATTTFEVSERSYNLSARNVGLPARIRFADGDEVFEAFFDTEMGLGPDFNANSCTSCHVNNGRQQFPVETGSVGIGPVVHVSTPGAAVDEAPFDLPGFGTRLQTATVDGSQPEARVEV
ncbi:MAG: di-heme oxidoredictase family protein, partial [Acidimicrobiaceae bacterium]